MKNKGCLGDMINVCSLSVPEFFFDSNYDLDARCSRAGCVDGVQHSVQSPA